MARDYDAELLESVRVRRRRLRDAFLHGALRSRRVTSDNLRRLILGIAAAAVAGAACAGVSFAEAHLGHKSSAPAPIVRQLGHPAPAPLGASL